MAVVKEARSLVSRVAVGGTSVAKEGEPILVLGVGGGGGGGRKEGGGREEVGVWGINGF